jgi:hypothetical protein
MRLLQLALLALLISTCYGSAVAITVGETTRLIRQAERNVTDPNGWAIDLHDVLFQNGLEVSSENVCAVIAIIDQESGFVADPVVPDLGRISELALRKKLEKYPIAGKAALDWLSRTPSPDASFMARIRAARTERDLDLAYRGLVDYLGKNINLGLVMQLGLLNDFIEERNEIDTAGSMQVSVKFSLAEARKRRWLPPSLSDVYAVRDQLYTRHGGMLYGTRQLLGYETGYDRKVYRFADYNAGRYAARNAAFQRAIVRLSGWKLALDGDLLSYGKDGKPLPSATQTEQAVRALSSRFGLGLDDQQIRADLQREKALNFTGTRTYLAIVNRYAKAHGTRPAFAVIPDIRLKSPKLSRGFTTRRFAESVDRRYQSCMASAPK